MTAIRPSGAQDRRKRRPRRARRKPSAFTVTVSTVAGALLLLLSVPNLGPAIRAARADGRPGTFTAQSLSCVRHAGAHESCTWYGSFSGRPGHYLYGAGRDTLRVGESVPAVDIGRGERVYDPDGSREWIPTSLMIAVGLTLLVPLGRAMRLVPRQRRLR